MKKPVFLISDKDINEEIDLIYYFSKFDWILNFFKIDSKTYNNLSSDKKYELISNIVNNVFKKNETKINLAKEQLNKIISKNYNEIIDEFAKIFNIVYEGEEIYKISVGICPICPRFLKDKRFDVCFNNSTEYCLQTLIHEMTHFYWFEKFSKVFKNISSKEYESPNLPWLLSEIVVDCIIKNSNLNKFIVDEHIVYNIFYKTNINNENLIVYFNELYKNSESIDDFIIKSVNYINKNKREFQKLALMC